MQEEQETSDRCVHIPEVKNPIPWPDPTEEQLQSEQFNKLWNAMKTWDINVPEVYRGYCGCTGNHIVHLLNALNN